MRRVFLLLLAASTAFGQAFNSGSTGVDGVLNLTTPGTIVLDPATLNIDTDGDNVFHFTTINIGAGVTVNLRNAPLRGKSIVWLASGAVTIAGTLDLNGQPGTPTNATTIGRIPAEPGPGGYQGGMGSCGSASCGSANNAFGAELGRGPGGGFVCGGPAAHAVPTPGFGTPTYGNAALVPLRGGSGGGGGCLTNARSGGGGAGGGALRIASSASITLTGSILVNGGDGGTGGAGGPLSIAQENGGGGSGGGIQLIAPTISGAGTLRALGGAGTNVNPGSVGRIRLDAFTQSFSGSSNPGASFGFPYAVPLPSAVPMLRVVSVAGIPVPSNPSGSFTVPDIVLNQPGQVPVVVEARNIPLNTTVRLHLFSDGNEDRLIDSTPPLVGTQALSTTTIQTFIPPGYSRGYVRATF